MHENKFILIILVSYPAILGYSFLVDFSVYQEISLTKSKCTVTTRDSSCGKVKFSQESDSHSVLRAVSLIPGGGISGSRSLLG